MKIFDGIDWKRQFGIFLLSCAVFLFIGSWPGINQYLVAPVIPKTANGTKLVADAEAAVTPAAGYQSKVTLGASIVKLEVDGVIDRAKFEALYGTTTSPELTAILAATSTQPILLTAANANEYLNLLWPLGLANYMKLNEKSPINGPNVNNYAATGGWSLGNADSGGQYFNKYSIVPLTSAQEQRVVHLAENMYRPCCGNSTFFQDCNHGSALLGLLELGVSQSLTDDELYKEAMAFNSFWFPQNYVETALYFKVVKNLDWQYVDPRVVMSEQYSSLTGWNNTVDSAVRSAHLLPALTGGGSCSV